MRTLKYIAARRLLHTVEKSRLMTNFINLPVRRHELQIAHLTNVQTSIATNLSLIIPIHIYIITSVMFYFFSTNTV